jgi:hypothetical protein
VGTVTITVTDLRKLVIPANYAAALAIFACGLLLCVFVMIVPVADLDVDANVIHVFSWINAVVRGFGVTQCTII